MAGGFRHRGGRSGTEKGPRKAWGREGQALLCVDGVLFALVDDL